MNVIVCAKLAPDVEDMEVKADRSISFERAERSFGEYDLPAIEAAVQLVEAQGGTLTALSVGASELKNSKARKAILSRGPNDLTLVMDESLAEADSYQTASILAAAIRNLGEFDLVLFGTGSADLYAQQVGILVGELLGVLTTNAVSKIDVQDGKLIVERALEDVTEVLELTTPAVLTTTADIALPRIPGMKDILGAGKKPVTEWALADVMNGEGSQSTVKVLSTLAPEQVDRKQIIREGVSEDVIQQLVGDLVKDGVL